MRVLHIYRTYFPDPPGGLQEAIRQIIISTAAHGVESRVFTLSATPYPKEIRNSETIVLREKSLFAPASCDIGGYGAFKKFKLAAKWADIIHYHYPWPFADVLHSIMKPTIPAIMTYHSDIIRQKWLGFMYSPLKNHMLSQMKTIVATSPAYAQSSTTLSAKSIRPLVKVIPLGIEETSHSLIESNILSRLGLDSNTPYILFIGVLRYYKGLHYLVEAAKSVSIPIVIAGSGPEESALKTQAKNLGTSNIIFAGQISNDDKSSLLRNCRALILPSHLRSEAFGMVLVEASMFGKPMITCEIKTGTSFVNMNNVTGLVVPPEDPSALAKAINILAEDESLANSFGNAAKNRYSNLFSGPALGRAYFDLYQETK
jgi:glycosyltransferase involved in cell wall biosynthesis